MLPAAPSSSRDVFSAIADPTRRSLLGLLRTQERSVQDMASRFSMTTAAISQHLAVLREAGIVSRARVGRSQIYSLVPASLDGVYEWTSQFRNIRDPFGHSWVVAPANETRRPRRPKRS